MATFRRTLASVLLAAGVVLVLGGVTASLGMSPSAILAGIAAIAALLYAGGVWFGGAQPRTPAIAPTPLIIFDRHVRIVSGEHAGQPVGDQFAEPARAEVERRCRAALGGKSERFSAEYKGRMLVLDAVPVRTADGAVAYGMLVTIEAEPAAIAASL